MVNDQKELTLQNLYDVVIRMDSKIDSRFDRVETRLDSIEVRLDRIELSTPRELEKRILVVEEDSELHDSFFRGFRETLKVV